MSDAPYYAKDLSIAAQSFLYPCAFWAVAADEELTGEEQAWLVEQFGADGATSSLEEFVALESDAFFAAFDSANNALSDQDKEIVYPGLRAWLESCSAAEHGDAAVEREIIDKIAARISLDSEIQRIMSPAVDSMQAPPVLAAEGVSELQGHQANVTSLCYNGAGNCLASGAEDGVLKIWDPAKGSELKQFDSHDMGVRDVCFMPDGTSLLSADRLGVLRMWNAENGSLLWEYKLKGSGGVTCLDVSSDGKSILSSSDVGLICIHDAKDGSKEVAFGDRRRGIVSGAMFSPDASMIAAGGDDGVVRIYRRSDQTEVRSMDGHSSGITDVAFSPDGKLVASASRDNDVIIWDVATGDEKYVLKGHSFSVYSVEFSPDGTKLVSAGWDHTFKVWDVTSGNMLINVESGTGGFSVATFSPNGQSVAAGCDDKSIYIATLA